MVFIQVYDLENPVVRYVADANYVGFMEKEMVSRKNYLYPPFVRLIRLSVMHKDKLVAEKASEALKIHLRKHFSERQVLGPEYPPVGRIKNMYIRNIMIKLPRNRELMNYKQIIMAGADQLQTMTEFKGVRVIADADPV
jgi:primosomal protein N' (replication factor Y)